MSNAGFLVEVFDSQASLAEGTVSVGVITTTARSVVAPTIIETGPQGPPGPQGDTGDPGPSSTSYTFLQPVPAATWEIVHNLNARRPITLFIDSDPGIPQMTDVTYPDLNTTIVEWPSAESGSAYI